MEQQKNSQKSNQKIDVEALHKQIEAAHKDAAAALDEFCRKFSKLDEINVPYVEEQKDELAPVYVEIQNRKVYLAKVFASRFGNLLFL